MADLPEIPKPEGRNDERERKGAGVFLPGEDAGQTAGSLLRGFETLSRNRWIGWLFTTAVGKGLLLGFALVGTTFLLVHMAERNPQQAPADPSLSSIPTRKRKTSSSLRAAWKLSNEGIFGGIPAKANMFVEQERGAAPADGTGAPSEYGTKVKDVPEGGAADGKDAEAMAQEYMSRLENGSEEGLKRMDGWSSEFGDSEGIDNVSPAGAAGLLAKARSALRGTDSAASGKTSGMQRGRRPVLSALKGGRALTSSKAAGQLRVAHALSGQGKLAGGNEPAAAYADAAFNQQTAPTGGAGISLGDPVGGGGVGGGGGGNTVPNPSSPIQIPEAPPINTPTNVTPYQPQVNMARNLQDQAASLKQTGTMLIALGAALIVAGLAIMYASSWTGIGAVIGALLVAIGGVLVWQGMDMVSQAKGMADQSKQLGDQVDKGYGQQKQGGIIRRRADESVK